MNLYWGNCSFLEAMKCFPFSIREKRKPKTTKSISTQSSNSAFTNNEVTVSGPEFSSENVSNTSTETVGRTAPRSLSQRPNNLRAFTFSELKVATKNFSPATMLGEGGFGCVHKGVIKGSENPAQKLDVAVKQLSRRGSQVIFLFPFLVVFYFLVLLV